MANKQTIAPVNLGGTEVKQTVSSVPMMVGLKQEIVGDEHLDAAQKILSGGQNFMIEKMKTDNERRKLQTAAVLSAQRQGLMSAQSLDEFNRLAGVTPQMLKAGFDDDEGKRFWENNGQNILKANDVDVKHLKTVKEEEFARNSLIDLLADREEILARIPSDKGSVIIESGLADIKQSDLFSDEEKKQLQTQFLENGILNLSLQDMNGAEKAVEQFCSDDENLRNKLAETKRLQEVQVQQLEKQQARQERISGLKQAFALWQQRERGEIDAGTYYVLSGDRKNMLWGDDKEENNMSNLGEAYKFFRKMHSGNNISDNEYENAGNQLILAYKNKKIGLDKTAHLQDELLASMEGKKGDDYAVMDNLADRVLAADTAERSYEAGDFMERKAQFYFDLIDVYQEQKETLEQAYLKEHENISAGAIRSLNRKAMLNALELLDYKEGKEEVSFADLKSIIKNNYQGRRTADIWQKYYREAPYSSDKKELMLRLARDKQKKELEVKRFNTLEEVYEADLDDGEPFYFQGRLAVKS